MSAAFSRLMDMQTDPRFPYDAPPECDSFSEDEIDARDRWQMDFEDAEDLRKECEALAKGGTK